MLIYRDSNELRLIVLEVGGEMIVNEIQPNGPRCIARNICEALQGRNVIDFRPSRRTLTRASISWRHGARVKIDSAANSPRALMRTTDTIGMDPQAFEGSLRYSDSKVPLVSARTPSATPWRAIEMQLEMHPSTSLLPEGRQGDPMKSLVFWWRGRLPALEDSWICNLVYFHS